MTDGKRSGGEDERGRIWEVMHRRLEELSHDLSGEMTEEELRDLWYRRALELNRVPDHEREKVDRAKMITFRLGPDRYGVSIAVVREVQKEERLTPVPTAPEFVVGVMNLRGNILSVVDIRAFFGLPAVSRGEKSRILVVEGAGLRLGVIVERVYGIIDVRVGDIKPPLSLDKGLTDDYVEGIITHRGEMLIVIDMEKILSNPRLLVEENV